MAEVVAPGQETTQPSRRPPPHGKKRAADTSLESEQRLSKRFDLLNLENGTRLYVPIAGSSDPALNAQIAKHHPKPTPIPTALETKRTRERPRRRPPPSDDCMQVEDTPHRVYIADLDAELSDIESDEDNPIFLQDIEKHLAKIPKHVLVGPEPKPTKDNQVVLYNVPSSLTVPEAQDSVRKAIVEARARVRERQANGMWAPEPVAQVPVPEVKVTRDIPPPSFDSDAMELD
ncbi:hypothetical protein N0V90_012726 [Kalmusia sp. IMI 367209]|nr:hypothetical protein N0V90_012726 [Kalmusia sp. IMI 367209]